MRCNLASTFGGVQQAKLYVACLSHDKRNGYD
jgi:hypothetical protein